MPCGSPELNAQTQMPCGSPHKCPVGLHRTQMPCGSPLNPNVWVHWTQMPCGSPLSTNALWVLSTNALWVSTKHKCPVGLNWTQMSCGSPLNTNALWVSMEHYCGSPLSTNALSTCGSPLNTNALWVSTEHKCPVGLHWAQMHCGPPLSTNVLWVSTEHKYFPLNNFVLSFHSFNAFVIVSEKLMSVVTGIANLFLQRQSISDMLSNTVAASLPSTKELLPQLCQGLESLIKQHLSESSKHRIQQFKRWI